ncbi:MAG: T9SS type A sorting domain-containing protein [Candidatus Cloacimonadaceae bacterium]|nr:T9SS type A sorting domain-containing protein [Candidatus Cloacimonadaceae bacterium]
MKASKPVCFWAILMLTAACLHGQAAENRISQRYSQSIGYVLGADEDWHNYRLQRREEFQYVPGYSSVIQSMDMHKRDIYDGVDSGWSFEYRTYFAPQVIDGPQGRTIIYNISDQNRQRIEVYDLQNRIVCIREGSLASGVRNHYFYNASGQTDSIVRYQSLYNNNILYKKRVMLYDDDGYKQEEHVFESPDSLNWVQTERSFVYYSDGSYPPGFEFRLHNPLFARSAPGFVSSYLNHHFTGLCTSGVVDSVLTQHFANGEWWDAVREDYLVNMETPGILSFLITITDVPYSHIPDYFPGVANFAFDADGYFRYQNYSMDDSLLPPHHESTEYSWEAAVLADDELHIPALQGFNACPNPFGQQLVLSIEMAESAKGSLSIYNIRGQKVAEVYSGNLPKGSHSYTWNPEPGLRLANGIYLAVIESGKHRRILKLSYVK